MRPTRALAAFGGFCIVAVLAGCASSPSPCDIASDVLNSMEEEYDALPEPTQDSYAMALAAIGDAMWGRIQEAMEQTDDAALISALGVALVDAETLDEAGERYEPGDLPSLLAISNASADLRASVTETYVAGCAS